MYDDEVRRGFRRGIGYGAAGASLTLLFALGVSVLVFCMGAVGYVADRFFWNHNPKAPTQRR